MKDPLIQIEQRYKRLRMNMPLQQGENIIEPLQVQIDIQNLIALVRAYEDHIYRYDDPDIVDEIESKIFGSSEGEK